MNEFLNLNWSWQQFRNPPKHDYAASFSDDEKDVFYCHLNEIDHVHQVDPYHPPANADKLQTHLSLVDPRNGRHITAPIVDNTSPQSHRLTVQLFDAFPLASQISETNHLAAIRCLGTMRARKALTNPATLTQAQLRDLEAYTGCWDQRQQERKTFLEFVQNHFNAKLLDRCRNVCPEMEATVLHRWRSAIDDIQRTQNHDYVIKTAMNVDNAHGPHARLHVGMPIEQHGHVWHYARSALNATVLPSIQPELIKRATDNLSVLTAEATALAHDVDAVLTPSVMKLILDSPTNFGATWNIQLSIRTYSERKNVCFFEELMPKAYLSGFERNQKAYEYRLRSSASSPHGSATYCLLRGRYLDDIQKTSSDALQVPATTPLAYRLVAFNEYLKNDSVSLKHPCGNYTYRMCTLDAEEATPDCDPLKLLLRTAQDVCERQFGVTAEPPQMVNLSAKVECKSEFGAEQMSRTELISEWCDLYLRPQSVTDRVRIDVDSGAVLSVTRLKLADVEADLLRLYQLRPATIFQNLYGILRIICKFPPNQYLLRHEIKHDRKMMIYVQTKEKTPTSLSVEQMYAGKMLTSSSILDPIPWLPIDEMELTDAHVAANVMPCAFPCAVKAMGRSNKLNDRERLLADVRARAAANAAKSNECRKQKARKHKKKNKELKRTLKKRNKSTLAAETIDPYVVFDAQGNILVDRLRMSVAAVSTANTPIGEVQSVQDNLTKIAVQYNYNDYQAEANSAIS